MNNPHRSTSVSCKNHMAAIWKRLNRRSSVNISKPLEPNKKLIFISLFKLILFPPCPLRNLLKKTHNRANEIKKI